MKNWNNIDMSNEIFLTKMETIFKCKSCDKSYNQGEKLRLIILFLRKEEKFLQRSCEMNEEESRFIYENMGKILHNIFCKNKRK